jgi:hypothetical protein
MKKGYTLPKMTDAEFKAYVKEIDKQLKGKVLFPKKLESAREFLKNTTFPIIDKP